MLIAVGLSKHFPGKRVIADFNQQWPASGSYLVAGANGVGKSTLLALLAGALEPDGGEVWIGGASLSNEAALAKSRLSYCPADCPIFPFLDGREWLDFLRSIRPDWRPQTECRLLAEFGLQAHLHTRFDRMSLGTARKFILTGALAADAALLLLDEPSNALDRASLDALQAEIRRRSERCLVLMTCHDSGQHRDFGIHAEHCLTLS